VINKRENLLPKLLSDTQSNSSKHCLWEKMKGKRDMSPSRFVSEKYATSATHLVAFSSSPSAGCLSASKYTRIE
jgi:hypothetical protein